jgi:hypothetical protein
VGYRARGRHVADGGIDWPRARVLADVLGWETPQVDAGVIAACAAELLPRAGQLSVGRLRARAIQVLLARDAAAADRRRQQAERQADVLVRAGFDGMATLEADLPTPLARACRAAVDSYARIAQADGDDRPIGALRAGVLADLSLRPWDTARPPVTADLTVIAPLSTLTDREETGGGGQAAEVGGEPITAGHLRELLAQLDAVCPGGLQAPGRRQPERRAGRPGHRGAAGHGQPYRAGAAGPRGLPPASRCRRVDRQSDRHVDRLLVRGAGPPTPVGRYTPTPAQRRFLTGRDRTCRHPGCTRRTDADHVTAYAAGGPTACENLCCLCRRHHRLKTHAPGWRFTMTTDGELRVTTPSGVTRTTRPPGMQHPAPPATPPDEPPPVAAALEPEDPPPF